MATIMLMHWREATPDQYDQAREKVGWDRDVPTGAKLHVSGFGDDGLHVLDVWESEQAFGGFMEERLQPAIQEIGIQGEPDVKLRGGQGDNLGGPGGVSRGLAGGEEPERGRVRVETRSPALCGLAPSGPSEVVSFSALAHRTGAR
jgi:hypothetical protein